VIDVGGAPVIGERRGREGLRRRSALVIKGHPSVADPEILMLAGCAGLKMAGFITRQGADGYTSRTGYTCC
jgi:hypothetical protein